MWQFLRSDRVVSALLAESLALLLASAASAGTSSAPRIASVAPAPQQGVVDQVGLTTFVVTFDEPVAIPAGAVTAWTVGGGAAPFTSNHDVGANTLTLTFSPPIKQDRLTIVVDWTISDLAGVSLDGENFNPSAPTLPSGDGKPGGQAVFRINVLQGDANRDGVVDAADGDLIAAGLGSCTGQPNYSALVDLNHDGCINVLDVAIWQNGLGLALPATDGLAPTIEAREPAADTEVRAQTLSTVMVTLSEAPKASLVSPSWLMVVRPDGAAQAADDVKVSPPRLDGSVDLAFVFDPALSLGGPQRFELSNAVADVSGELLSPLVQRTWTVVLDNFPTPVTQFSPFEGESDVALTRESVVFFKHPLTKQGIDGEHFFATFGGEVLPTLAKLSVDGRKVTLFHQANLPASAQVRITVVGDGLSDDFGLAPDVDGDGTAGGTKFVDFQTVTLTTLPNTAVCGRVFASELGTTPEGEPINVPLEGATITVDGAEDSLYTTTDSRGNFRLEPAPVGTFFVHVDGRTAVNVVPGGTYYPFVGKAWTSIAGQEVNVGNIYLPLVPPGTLQETSQTKETTLTFAESVLKKFPEFEGVQVTVPAGALFADDGTPGGLAGIAPVPPDRLPGELPPELKFPIVITVQTAAMSEGAMMPTNFDLPVPVKFPNLPDPETGIKLAAGAKSALWSFDHDKGRFEVVGPMTVTEDGMFVESDPGFGIVAPGWHGTLPGTTLDAGPPKGPQSPCGDGNKPTKFDVWDLLNKAWDCASAFIPVKQGIKCAIESVALASKITKAVYDMNKAIDEGQPAATIKGLFSVAKQIKESLVAILECLEAANPIAKLQSLIACAQAVLDILQAAICGPCNGAPPPAGCEQPGFFTCLACKALGFINDQLAKADLQLQYLNSVVEQSATKLVCATLESLEQKLNPPGGLAGDELPPEVPMLGQLAAAQIEDLSDALQPYVPLSETVDVLASTVEENLDLMIGVVAAGLPVQSKPMPYALDLGDGVVLRGTTSSAGTLSRLVGEQRAYEVRFYEPVEGLLGHVVGGTKGPGTASTAKAVFIEPVVGLPDTDADGLVDDAEFVVGTNALIPDTDGDGILDGAEVQQGTDPLDGFVVQTGIVATADTTGVAQDIAALNDIVVVADSGGGVSVFNVFNGMNPTVIAKVATPGPARAVAISGGGDRVAVAMQGAGMGIIDFSDPPSASLMHVVGAVDLGGSAECVAVAAGVAAIGTSTGMLSTVELSGGSVLEQVQLSGSVHDVVVDGSLLYALTASTLYSLEFIDGALAVIDSIDAQGLVQSTTQRRRLFVGGGVAYVASGDGYSTFDVSDPANLALIAIGDTKQFGWKQIVANGSGLGVACVSPGLTDGPHEVSLYDVTDPTQTNVFLTQFQTPGVARAVALYNGLAYVADGDSGLQVINYLPYDAKGVPPEVSLKLIAPGGSSEGKITGGSLVSVDVTVDDDVQVRNVELLLDGQRVQTDGNFPFQFFFAVPLVPKAGEKLTLSVAVRASDTGGNKTTSDAEVLEVTPDVFPPSVVSTTPSGGASIPDAYFEVFSFKLKMSEQLASSTVTPSSAKIVSAGLDGTIGTGDDVDIAASVGMVDQNKSIVIDPVGEVPVGTIAVVLSGGTITDLSGNLLDGDGDGVGGDDAVLPFMVSDQPSIFWDGGGDGTSWNDSANWSGNVLPGAVDAVLIAVPQPTTVTLSGASASVLKLACHEKLNVSGATLTVATASTIEGGLTLSSGSVVANGPLFLLGSSTVSAGVLTGTGDVTVTGALTWTGGSMSGTGQTTVESGGTLSISSGAVTLGRELKMKGTATWSSGDIAMNGGTLTNEGTFTASIPSGTVQCYGVPGGPNVFANLGTLVKSGAGTVQFVTSSTAVPFDNSGLVQVQGGTLRPSAGGTHAGDFDISTGATLDLEGMHALAATSDVTGLGTLELGGTETFAGATSVGALLINGGTTTFDGPFATAGNGTFSGGTATFNAGNSFPSGSTLTINGGAFVPGQAVTVATVILSAGTLGGAGTVAVTGTLTWTGGSMSGTGQTTVESGGTLSISSGAVTLGRELKMKGTATWSSGNIAMNGGTLTNGGTFTASIPSGTVQCYGVPGGPNVFANLGTLVKSGAGTVQFVTSSTAVPFDNSGLVQVQGGTLRPSAGGTQTGDFEISAGAVLDLGGTHALAATTEVTGEGTLELSGTETIAGSMSVSTVLLDGGTATFNGAQSLMNLTQSAGLLAGTASVGVTGMLTWTGGTMSGTGQTVVEAGGTLTMPSGTVTLARELMVMGTATWSGSSIQMNGGTLTNEGTFTANLGSGLMACYGIGGTNVFASPGTFVKSGAGAARFNTSSTPVLFNNAGLVQVQQGTLQPASGGTQTGDFEISAGAVLDLGGTHALAATTEVTGEGTLELSGTETFAGPTSVGGLLVNGGAATFNGPFSTTGNGTFASGTATFNAVSSFPAGSTLTISGGTFAPSQPVQVATVNQSGGAISGSGTTTATGTLTWTGGSMSGTGQTVVESGGTLSMPSGSVTLSRVLTAKGSATWGGSTIQMNGGTLANEGTFTANAGTGVTLTCQGSVVASAFTNAGTFVKGGAGTVQFTQNGAAMPFSNAGILQAQAGTLQCSSGLTHSGDMDISAGATLSASTVTMSGRPTVSTQLAGTSTGEFGRLTVTGSATLAGTLGIELVGGFIPSVGNAFDVLTYGSHSGQFSTYEGLDVAPGVVLQPNYLPTKLQLQAIAGLAAR